jgi:hypothetical protein
MEEHHGREVGEDVAEAEGWDGVERGDDAEGGDDLKVFVVLVDEG